MQWEESMLCFPASNLRMEDPVLTADFFLIFPELRLIVFDGRIWWSNAVKACLRLGEADDFLHPGRTAWRKTSWGVTRPQGTAGDQVSRLLKSWYNFSPAEKLPLVLIRGPNSHLQSQWMCWWRLGGLSQPQWVHNRDGAVFHRSIWVKTSRNWACKSDANAPNGDFEH